MIYDDNNDYDRWYMMMINDRGEAGRGGGWHHNILSLFALITCGEYDNRWWWVTMSTIVTYLTC